MKDGTAVKLMCCFQSRVAECLMSENLARMCQHLSSRKIRSRIPMSDALCAQKNSVVEIHICRRAVAQGLSGMEDERDIDIDFLLAFYKAKERFNVVDVWFKRVFMAHEIEA